MAKKNIVAAAIVAPTAAKAAKPGKSTPVTKVKTSNENPRAKRPGVLAIEAAGGNVAAVSIVTNPRMVVGGEDTSRAESCLEMLRGSKTIGDYLAKREKAGLGSTLGGYLPGWIEKGFVSVGKGKVAKAAKPAKV